MAADPCVDEVEDAGTTDFARPLEFVFGFAAVVAAFVLVAVRGLAVLLAPVLAPAFVSAMCALLFLVRGDTMCSSRSTLPE
jgi:hypothetical protein